MRMRSPNKEPKLNGELGSIAKTATRFPNFEYSVINPFTSVLLPAPGGPVIPTIGIS